MPSASAWVPGEECPEGSKAGAGIVETTWPGREHKLRARLNCNRIE